MISQKIPATLFTGFFGVGNGVGSSVGFVGRIVSSSVGSMGASVGSLEFEQPTTPMSSKARETKAIRYFIRTSGLRPYVELECTDG